MSVDTPLIDTNPRALMAISNELHDVLEPSRHHILVKGAAYKSFISQNPSIESAGMGFSTKLSGNANFISRAALEAQYAAAGVDRRRVLLSVEDPAVVLMGLEPILVDGEISGYTTSAAYGHTMGQSVAIGVQAHAWIHGV